MRLLAAVTVLFFACNADLAFAQSAPPSFTNHIQPILTKQLCNSGACHGAAAGKGGLRLTLRGYDSQADYDSLVRQAGGRRLAPGVPEKSLLLQKPSLALGHGGGLRVKKGSPDYEVVSRWIRAGALGPSASDPVLNSIQVSPLQTTRKPGDKLQVKVKARYSDGRTEDVTRWVKFGSSDNSVATVGDSGLVTVAGNGEAAITVWFSSRVAFARVASPYPGVSNPSTSSLSPSRSLIDRQILSKLKTLNIPPSDQCNDGEFIRRVTLDLCGMLPSAQDSRDFLADQAADKRDRLIDRLLARPEFVDYWTYKWSDLLLVNSRKLAGKSLTSFYNWIRESVEKNKPWDRFAREIITATGSNLDNGAANFFLMHREPIDATETITQAFLGMSVQCARCHNHPLEKWTQSDYYGMANLVSRVRLKNGDASGEILVINERTGDINHPRRARPMPPKPLDGTALALSSDEDRRLHLANWLTAADNPYFAKAIVNRVWRNFMGRGLVESEDDLRLTNPPSNPELMDELSQQFIRDGYDVHKLIRLIVTSDAYQRSSAPTGVNAKDDRFYSRHLVRRMPAEVLLDAVSKVTVSPTVYEGYAAGTRALQLRDSQVASYFLTAFGRPERAQTCSCERQDSPSVAQALHLANGETINQKLKAKGSIVDRLILNEASDDEALEELFLSALSRFPTAAERSRLLVSMKDAPMDPLMPSAQRDPPRRALLEDLYWAVLTGNEFLFNH